MNIPEGWPTGRMCVAFEKEAETSITMEAFDRGLRAALAAAPTPPAQEDEPVAEVVKFGDGPWGEIFKTYVNLPSGTKLYTRPADDKLRKAAEELLSVLSADWEDIDEVINLRAALERK